MLVSWPVVDVLLGLLELLGVELPVALGLFEVLGLLGLLMFGLLLGLGVMLLSVTPVRGCPLIAEVSVVDGVVLGVADPLMPLRDELLAEVSPTTGPRMEVSRAMPLFIEFEFVSDLIAPPPLTDVSEPMLPRRERREVPVRLRRVVVLLRAAPLVPVSVTPGRMLCGVPGTGTRFESVRLALVSVVVVVLGIVSVERPVVAGGFTS